MQMLKNNLKSEIVFSIILKLLYLHCISAYWLGRKSILLL